MLYEDLDKRDTVSFMKDYKIPLGLNSYKGYSKEKIICLPYEKFSGAIGIVGESGSGKTVQSKRVYSYLLGYYQRVYQMKRPGIIFDMQSEDHHLSKFPNSKPKDLFYNQGERPFGIELQTYAPIFIEQEAHNFDKIFGFSIDQFQYRDFLCIGMGNSAAMIMENLVKDNPDACRNMEKFYQAIMDLPKSSLEFKKLPKNYIFRLQKSLNYSAVNSLQDAFIPSYSDNVFIDMKDGRCYNNILKLFKNANVFVVNFHQEVKYYALYAGKILKDLYMARRHAYRCEQKHDYNFKFAPPIIVVEEADKLIPRAVDERNFHSASYWVLEILKRGRRYGFMTMLITQEASALNEKIRDHTRQWIIGKCIANDFGFFSSFLGQDVLSVIRGLDKSKHEFCVVYENKTFDTYYGWDSPVEINRETRMDLHRPIF